MNEVKKSLEAVSGITPEDIKEVKQGVLYGKRRQKKRNHLPAAITALVAAAVLFFSFHVLQDGFSTSDEENYEVNELIYDFMLKNESFSNGDGGEASDDLKQAVLQNMLLVDALIDYAESIGYSEDIEAIEKTVADQRNDFYADLDNEDEERKKIILQGRENTLGMSIDNYFDVLMKRTARAVQVGEWLLQHPQENPKTGGEVLGSFQKKHERSIADFMEEKSIPLFDLTVKYEEHEGTVVAIEGKQIIVSYGFVEDATSKKDELLLNGLAYRIIINDALDDIVPGMDIRLVFDALSHPVGSEKSPIKATHWEQIGSNTEPEYLAKDRIELSNADIQTAYEMCVAVLTDYYKAIWNSTDINLNRFIENENLKQYTEKKVQAQQDIYVSLNSPVKDIEIRDWDAAYTDDADGGFIYLNVPVAINKYQGGYGEPTEFLVRNAGGKLVIVDWYTGGKDTYDFLVRGENETIDNPEIWNDQEWVNGLGVFSGGLK